MKPIDNTLIVGKVLIELDDCPSTNKFAHSLLSKSRPIEGTAIIAYNQTGGRGQYGKNWLSEPKKNLTFSLVLYPDFLRLAKQFYLNKIVCNAIVDWLKDINIETKVKWPNDIYFKKYKLGGILIENIIHKKLISASIVGVGININQMDFSASLPNPVSLKSIAGKEFDLEKCLADLLRSIEKWYFLLKRYSMDLIDESFDENLLNLNNEVQFEYQNNLKTGLLKGVSPSGKIQIDVDGDILSLTNSEVTLLPPV